MTTEVATEAGKRLLVELDQQMASRHPHERYGVTDCWACAAIAAVEAEAALPSPEPSLAALIEAGRAWSEFYGDIEDYGEGEPRGMTQLDHGFTEYTARIAMMDALRAALGEEGTK